MDTCCIWHVYAIYSEGCVLVEVKGILRSLQQPWKLLVNAISQCTSCRQLLNLTYKVFIIRERILFSMKDRNHLWLLQVKIINLVILVSQKRNQFHTCFTYLANGCVILSGWALVLLDVKGQWWLDGWKVVNNSYAWYIKWLIPMEPMSNKRMTHIGYNREVVKVKEHMGSQIKEGRFTPQGGVVWGCL